MNLVLSASQWEQDAWPIIKHWYGPDATWVPVEGRACSTCQQLDMAAGIDAFVVDGLGVYGIACRAQWDTGWRTFTTRYAVHSGRPTEYEKRMWQLLSSSLGPQHQIHVYMRGRQISAIGKVEQEIMTRAASRPELFTEKQVQGGNRMRVVNWSTVPCEVWERGQYRTVTPPT